MGLLEQKTSPVLDRVENGSKFGRVVRKIVFGDIYADRTAVLSQNPIPLKTQAQLKVRFFQVQKTKDQF